MRASVEFLLGLLDADECASLAQEDWDGPHAGVLRLWQQLGFIDAEPGLNPAAGCPHCGEGVPYQLDARLLCPVCLSEVDPARLHLWRVRLSPLLDWIARQWALRGGVRRIDGTLWQMGTWGTNRDVLECFFRKADPISQAGLARLSAYRQAVVLCGVPLARSAGGIDHPHLLLSELLWAGEALSLADPSGLLRPRRAVRFDERSGALHSGGDLLGEVPLGTREYHLLACLAAHPEAYVGYADLKRAVLLRSGSTDQTDEANFCQRLKSRIKKRWVPAIDRLIATSGKGDGYRLRGVIAG